MSPAIAATKATKRAQGAWPGANRLGQATQIEDVAGIRSMLYCVYGKLTQETLPAFFGGRVLTYQLDTTGAGTKGRTIGFSLSGASGFGTDTSVTYGYDTYGRFSTLGTPSGDTFTYSYLSSANLVSSITHTSGWSETMSYESNRDLLASIDGKFGATTKAKFAYGHDNLGRRTSVTQTGEIFASYVNAGVATRYTYNDRSEVTEAKSYHGQNPNDTSNPVAARNFGYAFDHIGSRTSASVDGVAHSYTNNNLNQVTGTTRYPGYTTTGLAPANAAVTVNGATASRQGEYFSHWIGLGSASNSAWQAITITSNLGGSVTRNVWLPASPQAYAYDLDGNLLTDDRWSYTWDAENRLIQMETLATAYSFGVPRQKITFKYDYLGRRVQKSVANWNGSAYVASVDRKFIYDGWNLIGEYSVGSPSSVLSPHAWYAWGLDLSGTLQGGGGVGGLLAIFDVAGSTTHLPSYDGNGNVHALVNRANGALTAAYEYSAFGETLRATGTYAATNPFRFSTKYTDTETHLIFYGRRYYDPRLGRWLSRDPAEEMGGRHLYK